MVIPAIPGMAGKTNDAVDLPVESRVPMKFAKMGELARLITRPVKPSQLMGRVAFPPGRGVPGVEPLTLPKRR